jgi:hypothetical protein
VAPGTRIIPPQITGFASPGLGMRQSYKVTMVKNGVKTGLANVAGGPFYAVPANVGPRTIDYQRLYDAGIYNATGGIKVFAGLTDDAFWIDLGAAFDTFNAEQAPGSFRSAGRGQQTLPATVSGLPSIPSPSRSPRY